MMDAQTGLEVGNAFSFQNNMCYIEYGLTDWNRVEKQNNHPGLPQMVEYPQLSPYNGVCPEQPERRESGLCILILLHYGAESKPCNLMPRQLLAGGK
jgi:hypothetical protein